jgi:hypothetical protein
MAAHGKRHRLILYTYTIDRWWRLTFGIGFVLLLLVAVDTWFPTIVLGYQLPQIPEPILQLAGRVGFMAILLTVFLVAMRKSAYVQAFDNHLRLVTPFLRMNISYRRFIQTTSNEMGQLFPPRESKGRKREFLRPLASQTAVVLDLQGLPLKRSALRLFLSPFFFPDQTARLALLVPDWISFSTELESFRTTWRDFLQHLNSGTAHDISSGS